MASHEPGSPEKFHPAKLQTALQFKRAFQGKRCLLPLNQFILCAAGKSTVRKLLQLNVREINLPFILLSFPINSPHG
jgi:hypothetical protein